MLDRNVLRAGAGAAMIGAVLGLVFNALHPRTGDIASAEAELELVSDSGIWLFDHYMLAWAIAFGFIGLVAIGRSFAGEEPAGSWGRIAVASAVAGSAIAFLTIVVDGMAMHEVAEDWAAAPNSPQALATGEAVAAVGLALFTALQASLFGVTPVLYGVAGVTSNAYPRWLGYLAIGAGVLGLLTASIQFLAGISELTANVMFTIASLAFTVWLFVMGWNLWSRAQGPAPAQQQRSAVAA